MKANLLGQEGQSESIAVLDQLTQNWYVHIEPDGKNQISLYPTPGLAEFTITTTGPIRGMLEYNSLLYVVSSDTLWEITSTGVQANVGTLTTTSGRVNMAHNGPDNGEQIALADGSDFYIYQTSGTPDFKIITDSGDTDYDADCPIPTDVVFMDGYFIINDINNVGRFYISASYDGKLWDALDYATAERAPDALKGIMVSNRVLWLIGEKTAEAWFNSGNTNFPFEPIQSGFSEWGTPSGYSISEMAGSIFYVSQNKEGNGQVVMTQGLQPTVISTTAITTAISKLTTLDDAYSYVYQHNGHNFYVLSFPTDGKTFVYDITTKMWHSWDSKATGNHRSTHHIYLFGKHLVGDSESGRIFELDWDVYTDFGDTITRIRRSRSLNKDDKNMRHATLWLDVEEGVGDFVTTEPKLMLRYKNNGGRWSNEMWRSFGAVGEYNTRMMWRGLGKSRDRVYELKVTDPVKAVIIGAYLFAIEDEQEMR